MISQWQKNALAVAKRRIGAGKSARGLTRRNSLSYTEVKSPADGTVGTLPFRVGSLVGPDMPRPLTSVSDNNEMYVYFSMTENQLRTLVRQYGSPEETIKQMPSVALQLNDGSRYDAGGRIETISGMVNDKTGTLQVRAIFPNDKKTFMERRNRQYNNTPHHRQCHSHTTQRNSGVAG